MKEASPTVGVHRATLTGGLARKEATGEGQAKAGFQRGPSHESTDPEQCKAFGAAHGAATMAELAEAWGGVKRRTMWRHLRKVGYPQKKRPCGLPRATKS